MVRELFENRCETWKISFTASQRDLTRLMVALGPNGRQYKRQLHREKGEQEPSFIMDELKHIISKSEKDHKPFSSLLEKLGVFTTR